MTINDLLPFGHTVITSLADHLWQSTVVVLAAAFLTIVVRRNQARVRYALWLAASTKFLVPFSVLTALGSYFGWRRSTYTAAGLYYAVEQVGEPFTRMASPPIAPASLAPHSNPIHWITVIAAVWLCGVFVVLGTWIVRWLRIRATVRQALPVKDGRVYEALQKLQHSGLCSRDLQIVSSRASIEPGIFGILRPVLLWPEGISDRLDDAHLEAVIAHELCHVLRRDNLAAACHMLVEAIFWFHPLVWWVGARLIEERERACDEDVLQLGGERHQYAEGILKVCEFCLSSPLTCVSGVTGADLKKRMVYIMTDRATRKLNFSRKLLLWTAACLAVALPIVCGLFNATPTHADALVGNTPKFSSVSIKPHVSDGNSPIMSKMMMSPEKGLKAINAPLHSLLQLAYHVQNTQLVGEPDWFKSQRYDIEAKVDSATAEQLRALPEEQLGLVSQHMLQQLLIDSFKVTLHQESRDLSVYELVVGDGGSKLQKAGKHGAMQMGVGELNSQGTPLDLFTAFLSQRLGKTVVDKTGLQGNYAFSLRWKPDADEMDRIRTALPPTDPNMDQSTSTSDAPPLLTALQEQLGLKLQPQTERVQVLVIDHVEQPAQD